ncbi:MAG TPA: hypothetical protein VF046_12325 [Gemmatimonadales bacterium]|jgi:hypothetical protein
MDTDSVFVEASFTLGRSAGGCQLSSDAARMFGRILQLTLAAGIANTPDLWESRETGRDYVLGVVARIGEEAARLAGKDREITADIIREASNRIIDRERERFGLPRPDQSAILSKFCFAYVLSDLFGER